MSEVLDARVTPQPVAITRAVEVLRQGGLVALPTDTVYGLAANAADECAVRRIFEAKGRAADKPLPILIASTSQLTRVASHVPASTWLLAEQFWPGPLTLVLPKSPVIADLVTAGRASVAVRIPDYPLIQAIFRACLFPVAVTSANLSGQAPLIAAEQVAEVFADSVALLIGADQCPGTRPSTILDVTTTPPTLLRVGPISIRQLQNVIGSVQSITSERQQSVNHTGIN